MKKIAAAVFAVTVLILGWYFLSPLFIDQAVDEGFEFVNVDGSVNLEVIMSMDGESKALMKQEIMTAAADAPDVEMAETMAAGSPRIVSQGEFSDADAIHKGSGKATLYALPDGSHLVRFEDFRTTNGPALVVYLAKHESPASAADVSDKGYVNLGKLKGNVGNQNYAVPNDVNVDDYSSVVIWCELFGVLFSPASLAPSAAR